MRPLRGFVSSHRVVLFLVLLLGLVACGSPEGDDADAVGQDSPVVTEGDDADAVGQDSPVATEDDATTVERTSITVSTVSPNPIVWAPVYLADVLGFYEDEQLDVEVIGALSAGNPVQALEAGVIDFAGVSQDSFIPTAAEDPDLGVRYFIHDSLKADMLLTLTEFGYESGEELIGKTIGVPEEKDIAVAQLLMQAVGVSPDQFETQITGGRAPAAVAMERGQIDAFAGTYSDRYAMENAGYDVSVVDTGSSTNHDAGYATTVERLEENPELVVRFGRAYAKATVWMYEADPEVILDLLAEVEAEAVADRDASLALLNGSKAHNRPIYEAQGAGDLEAWQNTVDLYVELGQLEESFDASRMFTNDFIDRIWDFDVDAVREAAQNNER